jgi:hypothetical protein
MLLALGTLWLVVWLVRAQGTTATVRVVPASRDVDTQATYTLTVTVEDAEDLGGFEFDLTFDPALLRVDDVTLGDFLGSTGRNTGELGPDIDNDAGVATYGAFSFGSEDGPNGTGTLAIVEFTTYVTPGVSALNLQNVQIINTDTQTQAVQAIGGSVTILAGPRIGSPTFAGSTPSDESLTVTTRITNTTSATGVSTATLCYGYTSPYTQSSVPGSDPGGNGDGEWTFAIPPQGDVREGQTLHFSLAAQDGDIPPGETVDNNDGSHYSLSITDDDTAPPLFSNPGPATVVSVYPITLQVDIVDAESGITDNAVPTESVYVEWDTDGEFIVDAFQADMDWISGTTYAIDPPIAPLTTGITVTWHVYAEDDDNSPSGAWSPMYETYIVSTIFGDLDYDCDVDIDDIMIVVAHWNSETGDPDYDSHYDFDADGDIDVLDVMMIAAEWGNTCGGMATARPASAVHLDQEGADVRFDPPTVAVQAGVPFTMNVAITQVTDLGGFEFDLLFDPDVITITGVHLGDFLAGSGNNTVALGPRYDENGRLVFSGFSYGEHGGADGYGSLATLELTLLSEAEAVLRLEDVQLVTSDAEGAPLHSVGEGHIRTKTRVYLPLVLRSHP